MRRRKARKSTRPCHMGDNGRVHKAKRKPRARSEGDSDEEPLINKLVRVRRSLAPKSESRTITPSKSKPRVDYEKPAVDRRPDNDDDDDDDDIRFVSPSGSGWPTFLTSGGFRQPRTANITATTTPSSTRKVPVEVVDLTAEGSGERVPMPSITGSPAHVPGFFTPSKAPSRRSQADTTPFKTPPLWRQASIIPSTPESSARTRSTPSTVRSHNPATVPASRFPQVQSATPICALRAKDHSGAVTPSRSASSPSNRTTITTPTTSNAATIQALRQAVRPDCSDGCVRDAAVLLSRFRDIDPDALLADELLLQHRDLTAHAARLTPCNACLCYLGYSKLVCHTYRELLRMSEALVRICRRRGSDSREMTMGEKIEARGVTLRHDEAMIGAYEMLDDGEIDAVVTVATLSRLRVLKEGLALTVRRLRAAGAPATYCSPLLALEAKRAELLDKAREVAAVKLWS